VGSEEGCSDLQMHGSRKASRKKLRYLFKYSFVNKILVSLGYPLKIQPRMLEKKLSLSDNTMQGREDSGIWN
jgi:hypothetical protein